jgi:uncharacterized protein
MISYDEAKRQVNLRVHGFDFIGCETVLAGFTISREDGRDDYGEWRLQTLGLWSGVVVFIVHTPRGDHDHIISIRKAEKHESQLYWKYAPR